MLAVIEDSLNADTHTPHANVTKQPLAIAHIHRVPEGTTLAPVGLIATGRCRLLPTSPHHRPRRGAERMRGPYNDRQRNGCHLRALPY